MKVPIFLCRHQVMKPSPALSWRLRLMDASRSVSTRGGQSDIVEHLSTGHLAHFSSDLEVAARNLAEGIVWAVSVVDDEPARAAMLARMRDNVKSRFLSSAVAGLMSGLFAADAMCELHDKFG